MNQKQKKKIGKIVKPTSVEYTFTRHGADILPKDGPPRKNEVKKKDDIRKTRKDLTGAKTRFKSTRSSPKTQQGHSPVYE